MADLGLYAKITAIMDEVKSLQKDGNVSFKNTNYNYLSESKTTSIFHELFVKYALALLPIGATEVKEGQITHGHYRYRLINTAKPEEYIDLEVCGQGHDIADKGSGKASSYAYKYLLWRTFAIPSNDDPDQTASEQILADERAAAEKAAAKKKADEGKKITKDMIEELEDLALESASDIQKLLDFNKVERISELTRKQYEVAKHGYQRKINSMQ